MAYRSPRATAVPGAEDIVLQRPIEPAEAAQARMFEQMLRTEMVELLDLPPAERAEMRSRIVELDGLIKALRQRFPHPTRPSAPLVRELHPTAHRAPRALLN